MISYNSQIAATGSFLFSYFPNCVFMFAKLQVRLFYRQVYNHRDFVRDDQRIFTRIYLSNPHIASLDVESKHFLTGHHFGNGFVTLLPNLSLELSHPYTNSMNIGLVHCNNKGSNLLYERQVRGYLNCVKLMFTSLVITAHLFNVPLFLDHRIVTQVKRMRDLAFSSIESQEQLQRLHSYWDHVTFF